MKIGITSRLADGVNAILLRFGYVLVRIQSGRNPTTYAKHGVATIGYENVFQLDRLAPWSTDEEFLQVYERVKENTLVDIYRCYEIYQLVHEADRVPGDILEVGVWRGGTGAVLAAAARRWKPDASVWLADTFTGVVKAGDHDPEYTGGEHADTSAGIVADLLSELRLDRARILTGVFPDESAEQLADRQISLCHIDVDVYESALDIINWVSGRMPPGGILVFDDYGSSACGGVTKCVDDLRRSGDWLFFYNLNGHGVLVRR